MAASELVRDSILSVMRKTPSQSSRATLVKQIGQEILRKVGHVELGTKTFNTFSIEVVKCQQQHISSVTTQLRSTASKRERLWSTFHTMQISDTLVSKWKALVSSLGVLVDDLYWNNLYTKKSLKDVYKTTFQAQTVPENTPRMKSWMHHCLPMKWMLFGM